MKSFQESDSYENAICKWIGLGNYTETENRGERLHLVSKQLEKKL